MERRSLSSPSDLVYAMTWAGAIGAGVIALFFLALDMVTGRALETPLLIATVLFTGELPVEGGPQRLDFVALFSLIHFVAFTSVGALFAFVSSRMAETTTRPLVVWVGLFVSLSAGVFVFDMLVPPDLLAEMGLLRVAAGNALAAAGMTFFYERIFGHVAEGLDIPTTLIGDSN